MTTFVRFLDLTSAQTAIACFTLYITADEVNQLLCFSIILDRIQQFPLVMSDLLQLQNEVQCLLFIMACAVNRF